MLDFPEASAEKQKQSSVNSWIFWQGVSLIKQIEPNLLCCLQKIALNEAALYS